MTNKQAAVIRNSAPATPFWRSDTMEGEPVLFIQCGGPPAADLLFTPIGCPRITNSSGETDYESGRDFVWLAGTKTITLTPKTRIPFKTDTEMRPKVGGPNTFGQIGDTGTGCLWYEGSYFHELQPLVTYRHDDRWDAAIPPSAGDRLRGTRAKLNAGDGLKLVALGDSITAGWNASGKADIGVPPFQPAYPALVAMGLEQRFGSAVTLVDLAVGGTGAEWGYGRAPEVIAERPDLVILAFGMNDGDPAPFAASIAKTVAAIADGAPTAEVVLVASMLGNPDIFDPARFRERRDALLAQQTDRVVVADVTSFWEELTKRKPFQSVTGNNVNHPNDFGHRVYADIILALFDSD